jgi:lipoprotein NlpD
MNRFEPCVKLRSALLVAFSVSVLGACSTNVPAPIVDRSARPTAQPYPPTAQPYPAPAPQYPSSAQPLPTQPFPSSVVTTMPAPATTINERSAPPAIAGSQSGNPTGSQFGNPTGTQPGNTTGSAFHVVQRGETLYRIAVNNGLNVDALSAWNNIAPGQPIREGQVLRLRSPEGGAGFSPISGQPLPSGDGRSAPPANAGFPSASGAPLIVTPEAPLKTEPRAQRVPYSDSALAQMQRADGAAISPGPGASAPSAVGAPSAAGTPSVAGASDPSRGAPPATVGSVATAPSTTQPLAGEPEFKPGNGVEREGTVWTWPTTGRIASKFSERAPMKGVDIASKSGTAVVAAAAGKVIYVGKEPRGYGQMIVVNHGKETVSVYFHADKVTVKEQQRVTLGQRIAEISDASGNKMHFEVRKQGRPIDPVSLMPAR